jgi:hypothetical protein
MVVCGMAPLLFLMVLDVITLDPLETRALEARGETNQTPLADF